MDTGSGSDMNVDDLTSNGNDGTGKNFDGDEWVTGKFDGGIDFDGSDDYVTVPSSSELEPTNEVTLSVWVKRSGPQHRYAEPVYYGPADAYPWGAYGFELDGNSDDQVYFHMAIDGTSSDTATATLKDGQWHHLVGTYDGSTQSLYKDGQLVDSVSVSGSITHYDGTGLGVGADSTWGWYRWSGRIDEVSIYDRALSDAEIQRIDNRTKPSSMAIFLKILELKNHLRPSNLAKFS